MAQGTSRFDLMFRSLVGAAEPTPVLREEPPPRAPATPLAGESQIQAAMALFHGAHYAHCLAEVRKIEAAAAHDPRVAALLSACNALVSGRLRPAIERCTELIEETFYLPDLYCALGVLLVKSRRRAQAYQVFCKGLAIDPQHRALQSHIRAMGRRRQPVVGFLDRRHPANRALGLLRSRLAPS